MTTSPAISTAQAPAGGAVRLNTATVTQYLSSQTSLTEALHGVGKRRVVLLRSAPEWDGPAEPVWGQGLNTRVAVAPSTLAVHELVLGHLDGSADGPTVLIVLTNREQTELDPAILARAHKQRIQIVDSWEVVREAFGAEQIDPRLKDANWAAEALLDATPPGGWPRVARGLLSRRAALSALASRRLRLGRFATDRTASNTAGEQYLDIQALLNWSLAPAGPARLLDLRSAERVGLISFLGEDDQTGPSGRVLTALVGAEHGIDAVAFGLVCAALWYHAGADADAYRARGRAERWLGEQPPENGEQLDVLLTVFGRSCEDFLASQLALGRHGTGDAESGREARRITGTVLDRAAILTRQFGAESAAASSPVLRAGLEARFTAAGQALAAADPAAAAKAVHELREHQLAKEPDARVRIERVRMGLRLMRWLAGDPAVTCATVADTIERHIAETGWADRALDHIEAGGDSDPALGDAYDRLGALVHRRRHEIDHEFAQKLSAWTAAGTEPGAMLTVEDFLRRVVEPVVKHAASRRILLLLLDGMSAAIGCELAEELRGWWAEYDPVPTPQTSAAPRRRAMAAALPTLTAVSRTSLFTGKLLMGDQGDEKRLFAAHRFWGASRAAVFHKDDLRADSSGEAFGPALTEALIDERTHIAVVLNTIDDRLAKEQKLGDAAWRVDEIGKLRDLLRAAAAQGMAVLITSDHGHVVERHGVKAESVAPASARHRAPGGPLATTEIALSGPRVVWPDTDASIVALWDADARYTARKAGYHGGAALAEFAIPVLAFLPFGAEPPRHWRELGDPRPAWWSLDGEPPAVLLATAEQPPSAATEPAQQPSARVRRERERQARADAVFEIGPTTSEDGALIVPRAAAPRVDLVRNLLASENFEAQLELLARRPPKDKIEKAVRELLDAGGTLPATALAQRIGHPAARADGFAAVLRQVLNYDGVQVLETLPDGRTLRLNRQLLCDQFELRGRGQPPGVLAE
jgi:hypothetical protein